VITHCDFICLASDGAPFIPLVRYTGVFNGTMWLLEAEGRQLRIVPFTSQPRGPVQWKYDAYVLASRGEAIRLTATFKEIGDDVYPSDVPALRE
jgi:hypothetical protein